MAKPWIQGAVKKTNVIAPLVVLMRATRPWLLMAQSS